jgi:GH24 family phage-related lysozyme (muramidase)
LLQDSLAVEKELNACGFKLNQNQFDAIGDMVFNLGITRLKDSVTFALLKANPEDKRIGNAIMSWCKYKDKLSGELKESEGLKRRCKERVELYFKPV